MNQTDLKKGMDGRDAPDNDVAALLSALPRVEAPGNFDFGVRAKIASGKPKQRPAFLPFAKVAMPLALLLMITGLVFFYGGTATNDLPAVAGDPSETAIPSPQIVPAVVPAVTGPELQESSDREALVASRQNERPVRRVSNRRSTGSTEKPRFEGGSIDQTVRPANVIMAPGFESANPNRAANTNGAVPPDVPIRDVLGILGVTVVFEGAAFRVGSVAENSIGARAGLKENDIIETIDSRVVKSDTKVKGDAAHDVVVRRDGKRVSLRIGN